MDADLVLTEAERARCNEIMRRIERLQALLAAEMLGSPDNPAAWYKYLAATKQIQGNLSNDISFLACLMAKRYLAQQHGVSGFDASTKAQGAPGLDIDVRTIDGRRVIAEIKTTDPYLRVDFGAQQKQKFREDFAKLKKAPADLKYLFVTEARTYQILLAKYAAEIPDVRIVLLNGSGDTIVGPHGDAEKGARAPEARKKMPIPSIDVVWSRIEAHADATFTQIRGGLFTYAVRNGHVIPDRTQQQIPKSHFARALALVPLSDTTGIQELRGPSYIYAILMDQRIREADW